MKYGVYSMRDNKTGFLTPTLDQNDQSAIRNFEHACQNIDSLFFTHPSDYSLWKIADYETDTGELFPLVPIRNLCEASSIVLK